MATMASLVKPLPGLAVAPSPPTSRASLSGKPSLSLRVPGGRVSTRAVRFVVKASKTEDFGSAADAAGNSVVQEVAALPEEAETEGISSTVSSSSSSSTPASRKPSPLQKGGTLDGKEAAGKAPAAATLGKASPLATSSGKFDDPRWKNGTWDISMFASADGKTDWDAVIDAEVVRRKLLEANPESSRNDDEVVFDTSIVPWWAWVKRFHLPEAELLNGRAAMIGYAAGWLVDAATGVGLVDQQNSFFGKLLLFISVVGVLAIRKNNDVATIRNLVKESTYYDKQWQATWKNADDADKPNSL